MASCFVVARQPLLRLSKKGLCSVRFTSTQGRRALHASLVTLKKKAAQVEIEDLFSDQLEEELIPSSSNTPSSTPPENNTLQKVPAPRKRLEPAARHTRFEELYKGVLPHLNSDVKERRKLVPIRYTVFTHLVNLANSEEELRRVVELVPKWKDVHRHVQDKGGLDAKWGELIVNHAEKLSCSNLALEMFANHAKYQVPLSLPAARHLLHSLHVEYPLEDVMAAVALYRVYNLTPIADDLVSLVLVCRALSNRIYPAQKPPAPKSKSADSPEPETALQETRLTKGKLQASKQVFEALVQSLRSLLSVTEPSLYSVSPHARTRNLTPRFRERQENAAKGQVAREKEKTWLKWCLARLESSLRNAEHANQVNWLTQWRQAAGHVKAEPTVSA